MKLDPVEIIVDVIIGVVILDTIAGLYRLYTRRKHTSHRTTDSNSYAGNIIEGETA